MIVPALGNRVVQTLMMPGCAHAPVIQMTGKRKMYKTNVQRPRDSQLAKITETCFAMNLWMKEPQLSFAEIEAFIVEILESRWWKIRKTGATSANTYIQPSPNSGACNPLTWNSYNGSVSYKIKVYSGMTKVDALHMLAHFIPAPDTPWHGREFARALLDLFIKYTDKDTVKQLRKEYRERKIRTYAWSAEAKAGATERYVEKQYPRAQESLLNIMQELEAKGVTAE